MRARILISTMVFALALILMSIIVLIQFNLYRQGEISSLKALTDNYTETNDYKVLMDKQAVVITICLTLSIGSFIWIIIAALILPCAKKKDTIAMLTHEREILYFQYLCLKENKTFDQVVMSLGDNCPVKEKELDNIKEKIELEQKQKEIVDLKDKITELKNQP